MATLIRPGAAGSDAEVQRQVMDELRWDSRVDAAEVGVTVTEGVVMLSGVVGSYGEKVAAERAAHRVAGVLDVANDLRVHYPTARGVSTDADIAQAVRHALEWDVFVPDQRIHSTIADGFVSLTGDVPLWRQREDAERAIRRLTGVRGVSNQITVSPPAPLHGAAANGRPDAFDLREAIEEALERRAERHVRHEAGRIGVRVDPGGIVTITGEVATWAERRAILGTVSHAPGVRGVDDRLTVRPYAL